VSDSYWNNTICINSNNLGFLEKDITYLLEREGCRRLEELPEVSDSEKIPYRWELGWPLIITLSQSQIGWTVMKVSPVSFFCERAKGANRPRLSTLAIELGCDAFYFGVYDSHLGVLLEANAEGQTLITGGISPDFETIIETFYNERIDRINKVSNFHLLKVPESLQKAIQANEDPELLKKEAEWDRLEKLRESEDNFEKALAITDSLYEDEDYAKGHTERIDETLKKVMGCRSWYRNRLYSSMYTKLDPGSVRLYFQLPDIYQPQQMYVLDD
jgi:hypothetical protein